MKKFIFALVTLCASPCYPDSNFHTRIFRIGSPIIETTDVISGRELREWFETRGVNFPVGTMVNYANGNRHIISINSRNNQELIESILDLEKSLERTISKYSTFIDMCGSRNAMEIAHIMASEGWFSWTATYALAVEVIESEGAENDVDIFEKSLSNFLIYVTNEVDLFEEVKYQNSQSNQ